MRICLILSLLQALAKAKDVVAGAVVGHHPFDPDAEALVVGDGGFEEGNGAALLLVFPDLAEGNPRVIVDGDMGELPARALVAAVLAGARHPVSGLCKTPQFLDVDVDHLARSLALVTADRFRWIDVRHPGKARTLQDAAHGCRRQVQAQCDLFAGQPLTAE